jgi:hypothetical protein
MGAVEGNLAAVEQLRQLHAVADGEFRSRYAVQLGMVIADVVACLPDGDARTPELAEEGLRRLDEGAADAGATMSAAAVERARAVLSGRARPADGERHHFEMSPVILEKMGNLDPTMLHSAVAAMRTMLPDLPATHPSRVMATVLVELADTGIVDVIGSGRWKPEYDRPLARLDRIEADVAAAGGSMDAQTSTILGAMAARLHEIRRASAPDAPGPPHDAELAAAPTAHPASHPTAHPAPPAAEPHWPSGPEMQEFLRAVPAMKLMVSGMPSDDPARMPMQTLLTANDLLNAVITNQWTAEHDRTLADLRRTVAEPVGTGRTGATAEATAGSAAESIAAARLVVALVRASRCQAAGQSPDPAEWPDRAELTDVIADAEAAMDQLPAAGQWPRLISGPLRLAAANLMLSLVQRVNADGGEDVVPLLVRARGHLSAVPPELMAEAGRLSADIARLERIIAGDGDGEPGEGEPGESAFGGDRGGSYDTGPLDVHRLTARVDRLRRTGSGEELTAAVDELRTVRRGLPAGHPDHVTVLTWLADLLGRLSATTGSVEAYVDAIEAAIEAVRVASRDTLRNPAARLGQLLSGMVTRDQRVGPFEAAESALASALERADPADAKLRLGTTMGLAGARSLRARSTGDEDLRRRARETFAEMEELLGDPVPEPDWVIPAWLLFAWTASQATIGFDGQCAALVARQADRLEQLLVTHPELAEGLGAQLTAPTPLKVAAGSAGVLQALRAMRDMVTVFGGSNAFMGMLRDNFEAVRAANNFATHAANIPAVAPPDAGQTRDLATRGLAQARSALTGDRPDPALLRAACSALREALDGGLDDNVLRQEVNSTLGRCLAGLWVSGGQDPSVLTDAIAHLDSSLAGSAHSLPTVERAAVVELLARCHRESADRGLRVQGRQDAERAVRAALRELARCVLVADGTEQALEVAARANAIVARAVGWCLADKRPSAAAEIAEAGRSLVLASVVLSGRIESVLRGAGEDVAADAWRGGGGQGKVDALEALWGTRFGGTLLSTPRAQEISALLVMASDVDGLAYLVPPAADGAPAHAVVFRAGLDGEAEMLTLPAARTGPGSPVGDYLAAFGAALETHDPAQRNEDGFRGTPHGQEWARALEELGAWTYTHLVEPLVTHTRDWTPGRAPRVMLVPLGDFAAIPYASAWTDDPAQPGGRRYAVHDLVLSQAVSARLLGEVVRRPHQPLTERVVLVPDPTGEFPYARATSRALLRDLYPRAEVYGRREPNGPASTGHVLAALPGRDRQGASLLHLSTHAAAEPTARLQTQDGWLELSAILEQARGRAADSAGGLIITNACLTDSTRHHYDESVTLATALLAAGATGVIGTRWPIDDDTTATLTHHLHHRLALGNPPAEALRLAQLDMLDPRPRPGLHPHLAALPAARIAHPASWAAFVHHGT